MNKKEWKSTLNSKNGSTYGRLVFINIWSCLEKNDMCEVIYISKAGVCRKFYYTLDDENNIIETYYSVMF